jgi:hypothetical protein
MINYNGLDLAVYQSRLSMASICANNCRVHELIDGIVSTITTRECGETINTASAGAVATYLTPK